MRVAIVEDEAITVVFMKKALQLLGHTVSGICARGEDVMAMVEECQPELVIMDISLAGAMDGISAAQKLRERSQVPVLFASGYNTQEIALRIQTVPNSRFQPKPLDLLTLQEQIARFDNGA